MEHVEELRALDPPAHHPPGALLAVRRDRRRGARLSRGGGVLRGRAAGGGRGGDHSLVVVPEHVPEIVEWAQDPLMNQVLFEEDGAFRVGTILSEAGASSRSRRRTASARR
jgi:hypothetical protein